MMEGLITAFDTATVSPDPSSEVIDKAERLIDHEVKNW
jgi:hypothetical protein